MTGYIQGQNFLDSKKDKFEKFFPNRMPLELEEHNWMEIALSEAKNCRGDVPVGCVVVKDGKVIGSGFNRREQLSDPTAHAEMLAIRQAAQALVSWRLDGCSIYVTLEPCAMCAEAIIQARAARLIFGAFEPLTGAAGSRFNLFEAGRSLPVPEVLGGISEEKCRGLLQEFFKAKRRP